MAGLLDALQGVDERLIPRIGRVFTRIDKPERLVRLGVRVNRYMASSPWRDRFEQKLYIALIVGTFAVLWVPLVIVDSLDAPAHSTATSAPGVDRVTDGILFVVAVIVAAVGVLVSRRWRQRRR